MTTLTMPATSALEYIGQIPTTVGAHSSVSSLLLILTALLLLGGIVRLIDGLFVLLADLVDAAASAALTVLLMAGALALLSPCWPSPLCSPRLRTPPHRQQIPKQPPLARVNRQPRRRACSSLSDDRTPPVDPKRRQRHATDTRIGGTGQTGPPSTGRSWRTGGSAAVPPLCRERKRELALRHRSAHHAGGRPCGATTPDEASRRSAHPADVTATDQSHRSTDLSVVG
jgi:hypothetical protein